MTRFAPRPLRVSLLTMATLIVSASGIYAEGGTPFTQEAGKGFARIYGGAASADHYYDLDGNMRSLDTLKTNFSVATIGLAVDYGLNDLVELNFDMPLAYSAIESTGQFRDRHMFAPEYVGLGATLRLSRDEVSSAVGVMLQVPPGFHRGIYNDPEHPSFLSDGFFQIATTLKGRLELGSTWVGGSVGYTWRDEEPVDEIPVSLEVGFSRVEGTGVYLSLEALFATEDVTRPAAAFYAGASGTEEQRLRRDGGRGVFRTIDREDRFAVGAGAFVQITERILVDGRYALRLYGRNSLALQGGYLGVGYSF